ncbi:MAG: phosphoribosyl-ATP diphosphatase [Hyphomicrobiales bacterium]|jgi:phosphoribosyl-ATP pyrophosphohydrolase|nr:phosphoribosyl-ATP diphosphatase [Hyphomicrobiales bacterium]NBU85300.1 phosphoribosyl-ATP diphosphatase [Sphingomonadaceae bacterium]
MTDFSLEQLDAYLAERAKASPADSYTAKLVHKGQAYAAKKLGEEAVETVIAAVEKDRRALTLEAADLVYHLLVVLRIGGVSVQDVMGELQRRTAQTGLAEKASRPKE